MESRPDYYGILGVPRHTGRQGIRGAYLRKAWAHHPDLHPGSEEAVTQMVAINAAYETLSDPVRRVEYDAPRVTVSLRPDPGPITCDLHASEPRRHQYARRGEPGILGTAAAVLRRLMRVIVASMPL